MFKRSKLIDRVCKISTIYVTEKVGRIECVRIARNISRCKIVLWRLDIDKPSVNLVAHVKPLRGHFNDSLTVGKLIKSGKSSFTQKSIPQPVQEIRDPLRDASSYIPGTLKSANIYGIFQSRAKNKTFLSRRGRTPRRRGIRLFLSSFSLSFSLSLIE